MREESRKARSSAAAEAAAASSPAPADAPAAPGPAPASPAADAAAAPSPAPAGLGGTRHRRTGVWRRDRWVKPFFRQYRRTLALALGLGVAAAFFAAALMFTSGYLIGGSALMPASILLLNLPLMFVRVFGVGKPVLQYFERLASHDWVLRMTSALRLKLWGALERDAVFFHSAHRMGDALGMLSEDIGHIQNLYLRTVFPTVVAWALALIVVAIFGALTPWAGAAMLLVLGVDVVLVPLASLLVNGARQAKRKQLKRRLYADLTDNVLGVDDWAFSGRAADYLARHEAAQAQLRALEMASRAFDRKRDMCAQALFTLGALAVVAWAASAFGPHGAGVLDGSANWILAFALGYFPLLDAFAPLPTAAVEVRAHEDSLRRLNELPADDGEAALRRVREELAAEERARADGAKASARDAAGKADPAVRDAASPAAGKAAAARDATGKAAAAHGGADGALALPAPPYDLRVEGVAFAYPGADRRVIDGLSLRIEAGQHVAILGRSGSGKSTLASLVRGDLRPDEGDVTLGGVPTADLDDAAARYFGVIQQRTYLFNATLRDNLRVGDQHAADEDIASVLERVGLGSLLARLPEGLDALVDEEGLRFSGGERHRIALARVLLQDAPVVILDEPTVGLDPRTERAMLDTFLEALADKTLVMITHHLPGVADMDRVVFLEDGRVKRDGDVLMDAPPERLAQESPHFRRLLAFDQGARASVTNS